MHAAPARPVRTRLRLGAALVAAGACAVGLLSGPSRATEPADQDRALRTALQELVNRPDGPPGAIAVLQRGRDVRVYRAGVADVESGRPPRAGDHMRLASVSKAYSGAVALQLVERGKLRLDDTIGERLPRLPAAWHKVTLRQLLHHTSGLPDYTESPEFQELLTSDPRRELDPRSLLDFVADEPLMFRPGSRYRYDNSDNIAVALMAEAATGVPYEELLRRLVYRPLGLRHTCLPRDYRLPEPYLHGYAVEPGQPPEDVSTVLSPSGVWASGGIVATPADLNAFMRAYAGDRLLSPTVRKQQTAWIDGASEPAGPGRNQAGLALFRYTTRCGTVHGHTGNFPGYTQFAAATPDGTRSITVSLNTQTNKTLSPQLLKRLRGVEEDFVCALLRR
ncbi:serine hydrolase domain-containing protein [Streptomyces ficellus]|uniref:Class A beta-lactamase-related serine hydrolase n=1 Tax=Streptomyces ficellus TaxID=1977088 RepID=A0A6I6FL05_9ACTN|nr:serine hydrolase domain-containing protein [Streptomyces ficellus]QGV78238.1 class A beta-lactamase-related serine hydrolase [Streptomyces ficellus]